MPGERTTGTRISLPAAISNLAWQPPRPSMTPAFAGTGNIHNLTETFHGVVLRQGLSAVLLPPMLNIWGPNGGPENEHCRRICQFCYAGGQQSEEKTCSTSGSRMSKSNFRAHTAALFERECSTEVVRASEETGFSPALWARVGELGGVDMALPEAAGGAGGLFLDAVLVNEVIGASVVPVPLAESVAATRLLAALDTDPARQVAGRGAGVGRAGDPDPPSGGRGPARLGARRCWWPTWCWPDDGDRVIAQRGDEPTPFPGNLGSLPVADRRVDRRRRRAGCRARGCGRVRRCRPRVARPDRRPIGRGREAAGGDRGGLHHRPLRLRRPHRLVPDHRPPAGRCRHRPRRSAAAGPQGGLGGRLADRPVAGRCSRWPS